MQTNAEEKLGRRAYSIRQVAEMYEVSTRTIYKRIREGRINVIVGLGPWRISHEELNRISQQLLRNERDVQGGSR